MSFTDSIFKHMNVNEVIEDGISDFIDDLTERGVEKIIVDEESVKVNLDGEAHLIISNKLDKTPTDIVSKIQVVVVPSLDVDIDEYSPSYIDIAKDLSKIQLVFLLGGLSQRVILTAENKGVMYHELYNVVTYLLLRLTYHLSNQETLTYGQLV